MKGSFALILTAINALVCGFGICMVFMCNPIKSELIQCKNEKSKPARIDTFLIPVYHIQEIDSIKQINREKFKRY